MQNIFGLYTDKLFLYRILVPKTSSWQIQIRQLKIRQVGKYAPGHIDLNFGCAVMYCLEQGSNYRLV